MDFINKDSVIGEFPWLTNVTSWSLLQINLIICDGECLNKQHKHIDPVQFSAIRTPRRSSRSGLQ